MAFAKIQIDLNKKENGKFVKVGEQTIHCPTLADIIQFVTSPVKKDEKGNEVSEDGLPVYESDEANWVQGAMLAQVKAQARNKMHSGTAQLKDGQKIPETWAELTAEGVRDGSGLALAREFKEAFKEWVSKQGFSEAAGNALVALVSNKAAIMLQPEGIKQKVATRLGEFAESLSPDVLDKFMRPLEAANEACAAEAIDF